MSIPQDQVPKVVSTADGVVSQFSYSFYAPDPTNVFVASNGALVSSGWQAVKVSDSAGYVKFNVAPSSGTTLTIYRSTPMTQETDWQQGQAFYADTLTSAADKLTMIAQELRGGTVNVPGTVTSAQWASSARIASSATNAGSATRAGSATSAVYATSATVAQKAGSAAYHGPFEATRGGASGGYDYYGVSGGKVCVNGSNYEVASGRASAVQGTEPTVYLVGSSAAGSAPTFSFTTTEPTSSAGQFYAPIANFVEGGAVQVQFGNIVDTNWGAGGGGGGDVNYASSAGVASNLTASAAEELTSAAVDSAVAFAASASIIGCNYGSDSAVAWKNRTELVIGSQGAFTHYTTSDTASGGKIKLGDGLGGVIAGFIVAPDGATDSWAIDATIGSTGDFTLLQPRQETVTVTSGGTSFTGIMYTPKNGFVSIPVGANTDFHVYVLSGTSKGETHLYFYPNTRKE